jgi:hypothetical protein
MQLQDRKADKRDLVIRSKDAIFVCIDMENLMQGRKIPHSPVVGA